jgi:hypothetical protein
MPSGYIESAHINEYNFENQRAFLRKRKRHRNNNPSDTEDFLGPWINENRWRRKKKHLRRRQHYIVISLYILLQIHILAVDFLLGQISEHLQLKQFIRIKL